jgi:adenylosuccinate lyase
MPHKRNPESSEHLDTVARLVRAQAGVLAEGMAQQHERDGRGWKAEWVALPEVCLLTAVALQTGIRLIGGLQVNPGAMSENLERGGYSGSEQILARLAPRLGARRAQAALQEAMRDGRAAGVTAVQAAVRAGLLDASEVAGLTAEAGTGACADMTDLVVSRARAARAAEPAEWP